MINRRQKLSEKMAIEQVIPFVKEALGQPNENDFKEEETESPDFIFRCHDKSIGVEVIECHPSLSLHKKDNAPAMKNYMEKICQLFSNNLYLKSITEGFDNKLRIIIDFDNTLSSKYDIFSICATLEFYLRAYKEGRLVAKGKMIRGIRVARTSGQNIIEFNHIGSVDAIQSSFIRECIEKKNILLDGYKNKKSCTEYWLCIHLPWEEYKCAYKIDYDESGLKLSKTLKKSGFSRIFVTSCLHNDLRWLKGDPYKKQYKRTNVTNVRKNVHKRMNLKRWRQLRNLYNIPI